MQEFAFVLVIMLLLMGGYWSFFVYPRQREFTKRQKYVRSLSLGDEVITFGGMIGKIVEIDGANGIAKIEVAEGITVRFAIASIVSEYNLDKLNESSNSSK